MITVVNPAEEVLAAPSTKDRVEALQSTVSSSRLSTFLGCRLKFYFRYVLELQKPKTAALHVGSAVHAVLEVWNKARWKGRPLTLLQLHEEFTTAWANAEGTPVQWEDGQETSDRSTAWRLLETYVRQAQTVVRPEAVEVPVEACLSDHGLPTLVGVLDLVEGGCIVDYKTSSTTPRVEMVAHLTEVQTTIYALLYRENAGHKEKGVELHHLVKLKQPKVVITALPPASEAQEHRLYSLLEAYQRGVERQDFTPAPGVQCASCEFFNECRSWR